MAFTATEQELLDQLTVGQEMPYPAFRDKVVKEGKEKFLKLHFHDLRKRGVIETRMDNSTTPPTHFVKRVS